MIKFEKVSYDQFVKDYAKYGYDCTDIDYFYKHYCSKEYMVECYASIKLPQRATKGSAGYDFYAPMDFSMHPQNGVALPSGIRCKMDNDVALIISNRSGLGFEWGMSLYNTVGIIDSDYYYSDNEGHIIFKFNTKVPYVCSMKQGQAMAQGTFIHYLKTDDDNVTTERNGGIGSTDNKED